MFRVSVPEEVIARAKTIRKERDQQYRNIFGEKTTDMRWVGEVGEICFDAWLRKQNVTEHEWILERTAGRPDFLISGHSIGVKTVKRKVPMRLGYTAQITARHAHEPVEHFFFMCYQTGVSQIWFLGGITKEAFLEGARYYGPGDRVHNNYTIREGHEIYNLEISKLTLPKEWLEALNQENSSAAP